MPKVIDHAERAEAIAEAALRLIADGGLTGLSVRQVAEEAGLAVASLRRSFPPQASLRGYCMELIAQRVQRRTAAIDQGLRCRCSLGRCCASCSRWTRSGGSR